MTRPAKADDEELRLLPLSPDDVDEQAAQVPPGGSAPASDVSRPTTPPCDEEDDLALAVRLLQLSSHDFDEQVARLHHTGSDPVSDETCSSTPPNESGEGDPESALILSQLPADEQVSELNPALSKIFWLYCSW
jgi:hypothetical protein